jgi:pimeloyl-ACP methyl ester carboxylesterase
LAEAIARIVAATVETVDSKDGTPTACWRSGDGPPLVFLHGAAIDRREFASWRRGLSRTSACGRSTGAAAAQAVMALTTRSSASSRSGRRGRRHRRRSQRSRAVVRGDGRARRAPTRAEIRRAVLFDPRAYLGGEVTSWADELDAMLAAGEREAMLMKIYRAVLPERADELRAASELKQDLRLVPTIPRESRTNDYRPFDQRPLRRRRHPALFLTGSASGPEFHRTIEAAHAVLRNSKVTVLDGHDHVAIWRAPQLVARHIIKFLQDPYARSAIKMLAVNAALHATATLRAASRRVRSA